MRSEASSDVFKVWLYFGASVLVGGWFSPYLYNAGKALAEVSSDKQTNDALEGLADVCRAGNFTHFFVASLLICGGVFFAPLILSMRGRSGRSCGQTLVANPRGLRQAGAGFLLVLVLFLSIAAVLVPAGVIGWKSPDQSVMKLALGGLVAAIGLAVLQEVLFRGIAMGIFLRAMRPVAALGLSALLFALVHFLNPGNGIHVFDPDAAGVGFEMLRKIASRFADPPAIFGTFAPLLALGGVLAYARWRTASLWLPVGLHAGWIFINGILAGVTASSSSPDSIMWMFAGASLKQGIVPLFAILFAGVLTRYLTNPDDSADTPA